MTSFDQLKGLAEKGDPAFDAEVKQMVDEMLAKCDRLVSTRIVGQVNRVIVGQRLADAVPAVLSALAAVVARTSKPGVTATAYKKIFGQLVEEIAKSRGN